MESGVVRVGGGRITLDDLLDVTRALHEETLPLRRSVLMDPASKRLTYRTIHLTEPLKVAFFYLTLAARLLTPRERWLVYRAAYPHLASEDRGDAERLIRQGLARQAHISLPAFQLITALTEAAGEYFLSRGEGYWHPDFVMLIANYAQRLVSSRYLLTPQGFAQRLTMLSQEVGNAFTLTLLDETRDELVYVYEHTLEAIRALRTAFPPDTSDRRTLVNAFLYANASFSYELIHVLHPRVDVTVQLAEYRDDQDIIS